MAMVLQGQLKLVYMIRLNYLLLAVCAMMGLSSCEVIGGIFKAGVWTGILIVAAVVGLIIFIIARMTGKK
jgi:hypothetical protein